jgi:glycosyl transferase, family 25
MTKGYVKLSALQSQVVDSMSFKIFVINLDSSIERLASMDAQCSRLGLHFERISAVNGRDLSTDEKAAVYDRKTNLSKYDKELNEGEIGCYMSHIRCWERIVAEKLDYALILEDDAILSQDLVGFIGKLGDSYDEWDYIKLSHGNKLKKILEPVDIGDNLLLGRCIKLPSTATGQLISFAGAQKLLKHAYPIARPVDVDIQYWYERSLRCFVVRPFPVSVGDFGSEINKVSNRRQVERKPLVRIWQKIMYESMLVLSRAKLPKFPSKLI